jgi:ABC-type amino acid transport substrate-binding protein
VNGRATLTLALLAAFASLPAANGGADLPEIKSRHKLRALAYFDERRPEFFSHRADSPGFDSEILQGFAALQHVELEVVDTPGGSDTRLAALLAGKGDVVAGRFAVLPERQRQIDFTAEVFPVRWVLVTRSPTPVLGHLEDLRTYKVGTVRTGQALARLVKEAGVPPARVDDSFLEASFFADGLKSGRVSAVIWALDGALPAQREDPALQIGAVVGTAGSMAYGVRKEDRALRQALDDYISNLRKTPSWSRLVVKYFGADAIAVLNKAGATPPR